MKEVMLRFRLDIKFSMTKRFFLALALGILTAWRDASAELFEALGVITRKYLPTLI